MPDTAYYQDLERDLEQVLSHLGREWSAEDLAAIREEIGYGEYGLALEVLAGAAVNLGRPLGPELVMQVRALADRMGMLDSQLIRALRHAAPGAPAALRDKRA